MGDDRPVRSDTIHASIAHGNAYDDAMLTTLVQETGLHPQSREFAPNTTHSRHRSLAGSRPPGHSCEQTGLGVIEGPLLPARMLTNVYQPVEEVCSLSPPAQAAWR